MLYSFINLTNYKKYPDEINKIPFLGYFNHNKTDINPKKFLIKDINKYKYKKDFLYSNPYLGYIDHSKIFDIKIPPFKDKEVQCDNDYNLLVDTIIQKYKVCEVLKEKKTFDKGIQCDILIDEDFELVDNTGISKSSFLAVGDYLAKRFS